jgi:hypothetical protein
MDDQPRGNRTWQEGLQAQLTDEQRDDAQRTRRLIIWGAAILAIILVLWIVAVFIGFS